MSSAPEFDVGELLDARRTGDPLGRPVLSERQKQVVRLRLRGLSFAFIGRALVISEASARTHYTRALENLSLELRRRENAGDD